MFSGPLLNSKNLCSIIKFLLPRNSTIYLVSVFQRTLSKLSFPFLWDLVLLGHLRKSQTSKTTLSLYLNNPVIHAITPTGHGGGLDLTSINAILAGGSSGVSIPGDPDSSLLYLLPARLQEPHMPPRGEKSKKLSFPWIKNWIAQGITFTIGKPMKKKNHRLILLSGPFLQ